MGQKASTMLTLPQDGKKVRSLLKEGLEESQAANDLIPLVIFDVDETALHPADLLKAHPQPVDFVLELYRYVQSLGVAVMFMTARPEFAQEMTEIQLARAGYTDYARIILMPLDYVGKSDAAASKKESLLFHAQWKETMREQLVEKYDILAVVDDIEENLSGSHTGLKVHVKWTLS